MTMHNVSICCISIQQKFKCNWNDCPVNGMQAHCDSNESLLYNILKIELNFHICFFPYEITQFKHVNSLNQGYCFIVWLHNTYSILTVT